jgi:hypothetical protein
VDLRVSFEKLLKATHSVPRKLDLGVSTNTCTPFSSWVVLSQIWKKVMIQPGHTSDFLWMLALFTENFQMNTRRRSQWPYREILQVANDPGKGYAQMCHIWGEVLWFRASSPFFPWPVDKAGGCVGAKGGCSESRREAPRDCLELGVFGMRWVVEMLPLLCAVVVRVSAGSLWARERGP